MRARRPSARGRGAAWSDPGFKQRLLAKAPPPARSSASRWGRPSWWWSRTRRKSTTSSSARCAPAIRAWCWPAAGLYRAGLSQRACASRARARRIRTVIAAEVRSGARFDRRYAYLSAERRRGRRDGRGALAALVTRDRCRRRQGAPALASGLSLARQSRRKALFRKL